MKQRIVSFGEIMLRLTPAAEQLIQQTHSFEACYGGSESNVLVCLSSLGDSTDYLTALPTNALGEAALKHLRSYGVGTEHILRQGDKLGMYFLEKGVGARQSQVIYNRKDSEVAKLKEGDFRLEDIFCDCSLLHICGISFALSESVRNLCFQLLKEAKKRDITISFDFNYRSKLWTVEEASEVYKKILPFVDIVFASQRDLSAFLGMGEEEFFSVFPCRTLILRERNILSQNCCRVSVTALHKTDREIKHYPTQEAEFSVWERIGSGDAFAGGVLHILNRDREDLSRAIQYGLACFVLKHCQQGDVFTLGSEAVEAYINDGLKDVIR